MKPRQAESSWLRRGLSVTRFASILWAASLGWLTMTAFTGHSKPTALTPLAFVVDLPEDTGALEIATEQATADPDSSIRLDAFDVHFTLRLPGRLPGRHLTYQLESSKVPLDDQNSIVLQLEARRMYELMPSQMTWREAFGQPHPEEALVLIELEGVPEGAPH